MVNGAVLAFLTGINTLTLLNEFKGASGHTCLHYTFKKNLQHVFDE
jgi:hypothetical protein